MTFSTLDFERSLEALHVESGDDFAAALATAIASWCDDQSNDDELLSAVAHELAVQAQ